MELIVEGSSMIYKYNMYPYAFNELASDFPDDLFTGLMVSQTCNLRGSKRFIENGATLHLDLISTDGVDIARITVDAERCGLK